MVDDEDRYLREERVSIIVESGVPIQRANTIADCERFARQARLLGARWYCECGLHPGGPGERLA